MKPRAFEYLRPETTTAAVEMLDQGGPGAAVIAGGQTLLPLMHRRLRQPTTLIDIGRLADLRYVRSAGAGLRLGALTTHRTVERAVLPEAFGWLSSAAALIGPVPVRSRGTIGGSLSYADVVAEWPVAAMLHDADLSLMHAKGSRRVAAADFFATSAASALRPGELLVDVHLRTALHAAAIQEFAARVGDRPMAIAAVGFLVSDDRIDDARVVVATVAGGPLRVPVSEDELQGISLSTGAITSASRAVGDRVREHDVNTSDEREYLAELARAMFDRAFEVAKRRYRTHQVGRAP